MSAITACDPRSTFTLNYSPEILPKTIDGRLFVNAGPKGCCCGLTELVIKFFDHRYADLQMFCRSFSSMGAHVTRTDIERRIDQVVRFRNVIETSGNDRNVVYLAFRNLPGQTRALFSRFNQNFIREFRLNSTYAQEMQREMLRECDRVIAYQHRLTPVNVFFRVISQRSFDPISSEQRGHGEAPLSRRGGMGASTSFSPTQGVDLNIPGTVPYNQDAIPAEIEQKAAEINLLKARLAANVHVPEYFNDSVSLEIIAIPVFDASHPTFQNALRAAKAPGATAGASAALNNRTLRHSMDKDSLEQYFTANPRTAKCPSCRHCHRNSEGNSMTNRGDLLIDTALQDEILGFLRNHVPATG